MEPVASKAVFLSYASQDVESARRIADALRASGVEVWFDQSELRGGDAWDQKLRRRIKECALFIAIISKNTDARLEGYFRREWKLAIDRTHDMAEERAFLLPVVIDDTPDGTTHVPEKFHEVQWTRLPGGETPPEFAERVAALLQPEASGEGREARGQVPEADSRHAKIEARKVTPLWRWLVPAIIGVGVILTVAFWQPWRSVALPPSSDRTATSPSTEARQHIGRLWVLWEKQNDATQADWTLAEEFGAQAVKLEPADSDAWAAYAQATLGTYIYGYDVSATRLANALDRAEHAINIAPDSPEARFALANRYRVQASTRGDGERMLRQLVQERPGDKRILCAFASTLRNLRRFDEALELFDRAVALPGGDPNAISGKILVLLLSDRFGDAEAALDQLLAVRPGPYSYLKKMFFLAYVHRDLDGAAAVLARVPAPFLLQEEGAHYATRLGLWRHEPDKALAALAPVAHDFFEGSSNVNNFNVAMISAPKAFLSGQAHQMAGRMAAAQVDWRAGLQAIEQRLAAQPNNPDLMRWKAHLRACLGDRAGAESDLQAYQQLQSSSGQADYVMRFNEAPILGLLGRTGEAIAVLRSVFATVRNYSYHRTILQSVMLLDPMFEPVRRDPAFPQLQKEIETPSPAPEAKP